MPTYGTFIIECIDSHLENNDTRGADAIREMSKLPRNQQRSYAGRRCGYPRDCCMNAIAYAEQYS